MENSIEKAVRLAGSQTALATGLGITPQAVQAWLRSGKVPSGRCRAIEELLGSLVTRYELRPDFFGIDPLSRFRAPMPRFPAPPPPKSACEPC